MELDTVPGAVDALVEDTAPALFQLILQGLQEHTPSAITY